MKTEEPEIKPEAFATQSNQEVVIRPMAVGLWSVTMCGKTKLCKSGTVRFLKNGAIDIVSEA